MRTCIVLCVIIILPIVTQAQPVYKLYAGEGYSSYIRVIDPVNMDTITLIQGAGGYRMAYCASKKKLYSSSGHDFISVIDVLTDNLTANINPSNGSNNATELEAIVLSPDQTKLYVADESSDALFVLSTANDSVINATTLNGADEMENMVISPDGSWLYIVDNTKVLKLNTSTLAIAASITVNGDAHGIEISNNGDRIYSSSNVGVLVIDANTFSVIDTISCSGYFLKMNNSGSRLLGVDESNFLDVHDFSTGNTSTVSWSFGSARGIIPHPNDSEYFVATSGGVYKINASTLSVIDSSASIYTQSIAIIQTSTSSVERELPELIPFTVYPNPFHSQVSLSLNTNDLTSFSITDLYGKEILHIAPQSMQLGGNTISIDLSELSPGFYLCRAINKRYSMATKILKQ